MRWIHSIGAGVDGLVLGRGLPAGMLLTRSSEDFGPAIVEWCVARALAETQIERGATPRFVVDPDRGY